MGLFHITLLLAAFLCSLVAGFLFAFAVVVMPGIRKLSNREFIRAFQEIDGIIQRNQPVFMVAWIGSIMALIVSVASGYGELDTVGRWFLIGTALAYLSGVQFPTITINVPLNNSLQAMDVDTMNESACAEARKAFESRWNRSNVFRTVVSCMVSLLLLFMLFRY